MAMENGSLSASDVALLSGNNGFGFGDGGAFMWIFALLILANGGFGFGGNAGGGYATSAELQAGLANQSTQNGLQGLLVETANNNYETAQLINGQTNTLMQQNNTNLINAIQGFNNLGLQLTNQTNILSQQMMNLDAKMSQCCCEIKTQMLQNRLDEAERRNVVLQNAIDNANQSQYILGQLGRFVAWAGTGSQAAAVATQG